MGPESLPFVFLIDPTLSLGQYGFPWGEFGRKIAECGDIPKFPLGCRYHNRAKSWGSGPTLQRTTRVRRCMRQTIDVATVCLPKRCQKYELRWLGRTIHCPDHRP